ncbi:MAG: hypothetical protein JJT96_11700 [Opitutales bacterium]|nr:hypothetical protein [Opitutales bacterium]
MNFWRPEHQSRNESFFKALAERLRAAREGRWDDLQALLGEKIPAPVAATPLPTEPTPSAALVEPVAGEPETPKPEVSAAERPAAEAPAAAPEIIPPDEAKSPPAEAHGEIESPAPSEAALPSAAEDEGAAPAEATDTGEVTEEAVAEAAPTDEADEAARDKPIPFAPPPIEAAEPPPARTTGLKPLPAPAAVANRVASELADGHWIHQPAALALHALPWSARAEKPVRPVPPPSPIGSPIAAAPFPAVRTERSAPLPTIASAFLAALPWADGLGGTGPAVDLEEDDDDEIASFHFSTESRDDARDWREAQGHIENPLLIGLADAARTAAQLSSSSDPEEELVTAAATSHARTFLSQLPWK